MIDRGAGEDEVPAEPRQWSALDSELRTAVGLTKYGFASLQAINMANDFYHLPLLLLASGLERLCKCALCCKSLKEKSRFLTRKELKNRFRHSLADLLMTICGDCFPDEYLQRPCAKADRDFIANDPLLKKVVACLSNFGAGGRYYDLDILSGEDNVCESPEAQWQQIENMMEETDYKDINRRIVGNVERLVRALCRLFTLGPLGEEAGRYCGTLNDFLNLRDSDLGTKNYGSAVST